ncbi:lipoate--protein ligase family protein [Chlamydiifrater volucris]|uniref:lipoate--protein ligase family protein n=1 Tax=Chlamydiifrater volucris TaxID=2681470 RepID=UPI001BD09C1C|nr:biotin/lipoate A/B protein ligase family protein [Chlamydiifrater volucris]
MLTNKCFLIYLKNTPIYQQLLVEEALLRCDSRNICLININPPSSIVLGISCNPIEDLFIENVLEDNIPVVRRYSGGGTVYLDQDTIMVSWIISENKPSLSPQDILLRSYTTYAPIFPPSFAIQGNDYVFDSKKFGGNGQYMQKGRFVHHTSFLWDMNLEKITRYLKLPQKQPDYRKNRSHSDFLTTLKPLFTKKETFVEALIERISNCIPLEKVKEESLSPFLEKEHRVATALLHLDHCR